MRLSRHYSFYYLPNKKVYSGPLGSNFSISVLNIRGLEVGETVNYRRIFQKKPGTLNNWAKCSVQII
jgi:hypothetical protein